MAFDPGRRAWKSLPSPPLSDRSEPVVEWLPGPGASGGNLVVWGGLVEGAARADGAVYDPSTGNWTRLPDGLRGRTSAASTVTDVGVLVVGGLDGRGVPLRDGALLRMDDESGFTWEPVPELPDEATHVAEVVWTGREAFALAGPTGGPGTLRLYSWAPGRAAWREQPSLERSSADGVAMAASDTMVAVWETAGPGEHGRLSLFDVWARRWEHVPAPLAGGGRPAVAWVDDAIAVWSEQAGGTAAAGGALYDLETHRWSLLDPGDDGGTGWGPAPLVWMGNELLVPAVAATWRPAGYLPSLREGVSGLLHLAAGEGLVTVDIGQRAVAWRKEHIAGGAQGSMTLRGGRIFVPFDGQTVHALPVGGGIPEELEATVVFPSSDDTMWLARRNGAWTAAEGLGDGTNLMQPVPLPESATPVAGLAGGLLLARPDQTVELWDPRTQRTIWSVMTDWGVAAGTNRLAVCRQRHFGSASKRTPGDCPALLVVDAADGTERVVRGAEVDFFHSGNAAFAPGDEALAVPTRIGETDAVVVVGNPGGKPRLDVVVELDGPVSGPLAWHPDGRWLFAALAEGLVVIDSDSGQAFYTGIDLPSPVYGMVVSSR